MLEERWEAAEEIATTSGEREMMKTSLLLFTFALLLCSASTYAQVIYLALECKEPCEQCTVASRKIEFNADPKTGMVLRIADDKNVDRISDCKVLDKDNWVCDTLASVFIQTGKYLGNKNIFEWERV